MSSHTFVDHNKMLFRILQDLYISREVRYLSWKASLGYLFSMLWLRCFGPLRVAHGVTKTLNYQLCDLGDTLL